MIPGKVPDRVHDPSAVDVEQQIGRPQQVFTEGVRDALGGTPGRGAREDPREVQTIPRRLPPCGGEGERVRHRNADEGTAE
jgi:hypothetical protein